MPFASWKDKGIKKKISLKLSQNHCVRLIANGYGQAESAAIEFNEKTGDFRVYTVREVVDEVFDSRLEISLKDALAISSAYELGDKIKLKNAPAEFGRVAANLPNKPSWKNAQSKLVRLPITLIKNMKMKLWVERLGVLIIRLSMSILGSIEAQSV